MESNDSQNKGEINVTTIQKWGNSLGVRIPRNIAKKIPVDIGSDVQISVKNQSIVLEPLEKEPTLNELLEQVTPENKHDEFDFGKSVGKELI